MIGKILTTKEERYNRLKSIYKEDARELIWSVIYRRSKTKYKHYGFIYYIKDFLGEIRLAKFIDKEEIWVSDVMTPEEGISLLSKNLLMDSLKSIKDFNNIVSNQVYRDNNINDYILL